MRSHDEVVDEFNPYGAEVKFPGDAVSVGGGPVLYTVTYSVTLITEHALVVEEIGIGSRGSTMTMDVLSGAVVVVSVTAATLTSSGGP